jgi:hypothetical protein
MLDAAVPPAPSVRPCWLMVMMMAHRPWGLLLPLLLLLRLPLL